jgi:hypothetical protein
MLYMRWKQKVSNRKEGASVIKVAKVPVMTMGQRARDGVEKQKQFLANKP